MKLGILEAGKPPRSLASFGDYPAMFRALLGENAYAYETYTICDGDFPASADACEAWLITGAAAGVYDPDPWIPALMDFLRTARGRVPMVGVCFGHQAMAEAFGGKVIKSPKGWGVGLHHYAVEAREGWIDATPEVASLAWHQDQVVQAPPGATRVAGNAFCPIGFLGYELDRAISIQLHPEFDPGYVRAGLERRKMGLSDAATEAAIAGLEAPNDNVRLGAWIRRFLDRSAGS